jgi:peptide/nickel transport system permease protein
MVQELNFRLAFAFLIIAGFVLAAAFSGWIAPNDPVKAKTSDRLSGPSWNYPLGTDQMGRCILSRVIFGTRVSLLIGSFVVLSAVAAGTALGCIAGYFEGPADEALMRIVDALMAFPSMFLTLAVMGFLGAGMTNMILSLVLVEWTGYARLVRGLMISLKGREFLEAAEGLGASDLYIVTRHMLPNIIPHVAVVAALGVGYTILGAASLSFLGLGVQPPTPEWGSMMSDGRPFIRTAPQIMIFPGLAITLVVLGFNLLGEALRERMDPRSGKGNEI